MVKRNSTAFILFCVHLLGKFAQTGFRITLHQHRVERHLCGYCDVAYGGTVIIERKETLGAVQTGEFCRTEDSREVQYCETDCCGRGRKQECCANNIGLIIACVLGGVFLVIMVVTFICCCIQLKKKKARAGVSVNPSAGSSTLPTAPPYQPYQSYPQTQPYAKNPNQQWPDPPDHGVLPAPPVYTLEPDPAHLPPAYSNNYGLSDNSSNDKSTPAVYTPVV